MAREKALRLLSIARKGRRVELGEEPVRQLTRDKRARLVLVAADASPHSLDRAYTLVKGSRQPVLVTPFDKATLGGAMGTASCALAAFNDVALALAFCQALEPGDVPPELLSDLEARVQRVRDKAAAGRHSKKRNV